METWLALLVAVAVLILAIVRIRLYIAFLFRRSGADDFVHIDVYLLNRLVLYHMEIPVINLIPRQAMRWMESEIETPGGETQTHAKAEQRFARTTWDIFLHHPRHWHYLVRQFRYYTRLYKKVARRILSSICCERLIWKTRYGADDAALTAIAAGVIWMLKSEVYRFMTRRLKRTATPTFRVTPLYSRSGLEVELECIFSLRLGSLINAVWSLIHFPEKGVKRQWANTQSRA